MGFKEKREASERMLGEEGPQEIGSKTLSLSFLFCSRTSELFANQPLFHFPPR